LTCVFLSQTVAEADANNTSSGTTTVSVRIHSSTPSSSMKPQEETKKEHHHHQPQTIVELSTSRNNGSQIHHAMGRPGDAMVEGGLLPEEVIPIDSNAHDT